jgi:hypothetical protein
VRFEITELESGVELVLFHRDLAPKVAAGVGAGWHAHLEFLEALLRGEDFDFESRFNELRPVYGEIAAKL